QWPLPEGDMEITNPALLTAGHDGLPIGNLNWDPALRANYRAPHEPALGVKEVYSPEFTLYPNPAMDMLFISSVEEVQMIEVLNILGKVEITRPVYSHTTFDVDISALPEGLYIMRVSSNHGTRSKLFIKH
ncbi:MAG: T9SS type A sorting domain-containing protein, partial [Bacteroidota bacterium]